jgi:GNAT superfamily N-acetyltransferase
MIYIQRTSIYKIPEYSKHLKSLPEEDRYSRFGYRASDYNIDQMILEMCYHHKDHELWYARTDDRRVGWGHMAKNKDGSWELAVSVEHDYQRQGIGDKLISEMLEWAKFHHIPEVYMHCIEANRVIQHLAIKHNLKTKEKGDGERTAALEVPEANVFESNAQLWKEHNEIMNEFARLRKRYKELWSTAILPKQLL